MRSARAVSAVPITNSTDAFNGGVSGTAPKASPAALAANAQIKRLLLGYPQWQRMLSIS
jgi:hypothetical protein